MFNARSLVRGSAVVAALALAFTLDASANMVFDGDFEGDGGSHAPDNNSYGYGSDYITGWTVQGKLGFYNVQWLKTGFTSSLTAFDGIGFLDLTGNPDYGPAGIFQGFNTIVGQAYRVKFELGYGPSDQGFGGPVSMTVSTGGSGPGDSVGKQLYTVGTGADAQTGTVWTQFTYDFVASDLNTLLRFDGESAHNFMGLDAVDVEFGPAAPPPIVVDPPSGNVTIPEPAPIALLGLGMVGALIARRRRTTR